MAQYTIRRIPEAIDRELREWARRQGVSLNEAAIEALRRGLGVFGETIEYHDLDDLAGSWKEDPVFDASMAAQDIVDPDQWR